MVDLGAVDEFESDCDSEEDPFADIDEQQILNALSVTILPLYVCVYICLHYAFKMIIYILSQMVLKIPFLS